ncbi:MAG: BrnA antitoxin family protein [Acidobacteriia bacterium]|nr:BrnA antitoxin family protein [Terriglobia bacterium]
MFHVERFVDASMYVHWYAYNDCQVKQGKRIKRRRRIARLKASSWYRPAKKQVCLRLDADVLAWFRREGPGYQTRINEALRKVMREERERSGE